MEAEPKRRMRGGKRKGPQLGKRKKHYKSQNKSSVNECSSLCNKERNRNDQRISETPKSTKSSTMGKKEHKNDKQGRVSFGATTTTTIDSLYLLKALHGCSGIGEVIAMLVAGFGDKVVDLMASWEYQPNDDPGFTQAHNDLQDLQRRLDVGRINDVLNMLLINYLCQLIQSPGGQARFPRDQSTEHSQLDSDMHSSPADHSELGGVPLDQVENSPSGHSYQVTENTHTTTQPYSISQQEIYPLPLRTLINQEPEAPSTEHDSLILKCESVEEEKVGSTEQMLTDNDGLPHIKTEATSGNEEVDSYKVGYTQQEKSNRNDLIAKADTDTLPRRGISGVLHCKLCDFETNNKRNLWRHVKRTHEERKNKCKKCDKTFAIRSDLIKHMVIHDNSDLLCTVCGKVFRSKSGLKDHSKAHESSEFVCDICEQKFTRRDKLNDHLKVHMSIKEYKCCYCKKQFVRKYHKSRHERICAGNDKRSITS